MFYKSISVIAHQYQACHGLHIMAFWIPDGSNGVFRYPGTVPAAETGSKTYLGTLLLALLEKS